MLRAAPLALCVVAGVCAAPLARGFDAPVLGAVLVVVSGFGLLGACLPAARVRQASWLALVALLALPHRGSFDGILGWPLRVATARVASALLDVMGTPHSGAPALLVLENGVADVDVPCSGTSSFWLAAVALALLAFLRDARVARTGAALLVAFIVLLWGNALRVAVLALLALHLDQPALARVVHEPIGALVFLAACGAALWLIGPRGAPRTDDDTPPPPLPLAVAVAIAGALVVSALGAGIVRPAAHDDALELALVDVPAAFVELPLTPAEESLTAARALARKHRFDIDGLRGSVLVVVSRSWRAHHAPEHCLVAHGHVVTDAALLAFAPDLTARTAAVDGHARLAAFFVSPTRTTPDVLERVLRDVVLRERPWASVSLLLDPLPSGEAVDVHDPRLARLVLDLRARAARALRGLPP
jgi:exosortase O